MTVAVKLSAKKIALQNLEWLNENLKGIFEIEFEDGSVHLVSARTTIFSNFFWRINLQYNLPITFNHHVESLFKSNIIITADTHLKLFGNIAMDVRNHLDGKGLDIRKELTDVAKLGYEATNDLYNYAVEDLLMYVSTTNIEDFVEIAIDPTLMAEKERIKAAIENGADLYESGTMINTLYENATKLMENKYSTNKLTMASKAGAINHNQLMQCVVARGACTDIDNTAFGKPIVDSFIDGIIKIDDSMMEARSSSIALNATKADLEQSEYMNRRFQLVTMSVRNVHHGDCGSRETIPFVVRDAVDFKALLGTHYEKDNKIFRITEKDKGLIGTVINRRTILAGCAHPDPAGICSTCLSDIASFIPHNTNIGHALTVPNTEVISQAILSKKHLLGSAIISSITVPDVDAPYIRTIANKPYYYLNSDLKKNKEVKVIISNSQILSTADIFSQIDLSKISAMTLAELEVFEVEYGDESMQDTVPIQLKRNNRKATFTIEFVKYLRDNQDLVSMASKGKTTVDMANWNYDEPIFAMPMKSSDMSDLQRFVERTVESSMTDIYKRAQNTKPMDVLITLFDELKTKVNVSIPTLEVIIYAYCMVDVIGGNYSLPKAGQSVQTGVGQHVISNRSLGGKLAYQGHKAFFMNPRAYMVNNRHDHPLDQLLFPDLFK